MAGGEEGERPHGHQPEVLRPPVALRPLVGCQPAQAPVDRGLAFGGAAGRPRTRAVARATAAIRGKPCRISVGEKCMLSL
ncbi:MAG: hypothetical protein EBZ59_10550 [Planctomycetia bacterium]|nr:hypothetical protein [Planctomycetia bacterium]